MIIDLKTPVEIGGRRIERIDMRRPRVRDLLAAEKAAKGDAEREIRLFSSLCEVEPAVIEELDLADYGRLQEAYRGFLA
ncbi:phage tail assembly protein [Mycolicibacterium sp.]|uniref:phage tail assembly protein n=1 Tax=Mycolicibacterium sp. TaxID=2320850 RepID=UPI00355D49B3